MEEDEEVGHDGLPERQDLGDLQIGDNFVILVEEGNEKGILCVTMSKSKACGTRGLHMFMGKFL
jgi:hypothetical protein